MHPAQLIEATDKETVAPELQRPVTEAPGMTRYRWYGLALLTLVYTINNVDRNLVPALGEPIKREFALSDSQLGFLAGVVYAIPFTLASLPLGLLIDRVNRARLLGGLLAIWSGATMLGGLVSSFTTLVLARAGIAAAESGASPTSMSLIADFFDRHQRATAVGIFFLSNSIGMAIGYAMGGIIAVHFGWRSAFVLAGAAGLAVSVLVWLTLREPPRGAFDPGQSSHERASLLGTLKVVAGQRTLRLLCSAGVVLILGQAGIAAFMTPFFVRVHQVPIDQTGLVVALILGAGSAIGIPAGGVLSDRLSHHSPRSACFFAAAMTVLGVPVGIIGLSVASVTLSVACLLIYSALITCFYGVLFATYLSTAPAHMRGAASAVLIVMLNLVGYGLGPQISGVLSDLYSASGSSQPLRAALISMTSIFIGGAILLVLAGRSAENARAT